MSNAPGALSIGIAAAVGVDVATALAPHLEAAGFHALWVNDTPGHDALEVLAAAARVTERLTLATGVIPVDRRSPAAIAEQVVELDLPAHRLVLGIGSGATKQGALALVTDAASALSSLTSARVMIGALGPRMRRRAAESSSGPLLSWLTPAAAAEQSAEAHAVAGDTHTALYARTALDAAAYPRLIEEAERYATFPSYAKNFARLGISARDTCIGPEDAVSAIAAYRRGVDELVLRAITVADTPDEYIAFARRAAEGSEL